MLPCHELSGTPGSSPGGAEDSRGLWCFPDLLGVLISQVAITIISRQQECKWKGPDLASPAEAGCPETGPAGSRARCLFWGQGVWVGVEPFVVEGSKVCRPEVFPRRLGLSSLPPTPDATCSMPQQKVKASLMFLQSP